MKPTWEREGVQLYLGDCREVLPGLADGCADLVFTDPPYGHGNNDGDLIANREKALGRGTAGAARPIANDGAEANEIFRATLPELDRLLARGGCCCCCCCCCGGGGPDPQFARWSLWLDEVLKFKQMVVWDKGPMGMGWHYRRSYETVLVAEKRGNGPCKWHTDRSDVENIIRPGAEGIRKIIPGRNTVDGLPQGVASAHRMHPTEKPVELAAHFVRLHSLPGETVLDPFSGAGSTGVAAVSLGRKFIGIEIDPHWFDIAVDRIERATTGGPLFAQKQAELELV